MEKIAIIGGRGFVGGRLTKYFISKGFAVEQFGRELFDRRSVADVSSTLGGYEIIINLAGVSIAKRWTKRYKNLIYESRINTTTTLVKAINSLPEGAKPRLVISTSAVGYYPEGAVMAEESHKGGYDFLAIVCRDWERAIDKIEGDVRVVKTRFAVILDRTEGAFPRMVASFKWGLATLFGSGKQHFSWIYIDDLLRAFEFIVENQTVCGAVNISAPDSPQNRDVARQIAKHYTTLMKIRLPTLLLRTIIGEGEVVLTANKSAFPRKLVDAGFRFNDTTLESALKRLIGQKFADLNKKI